MGSENCFLMDLDWANTLKFCKELQNRPKRFLGPGNLKDAQSGMNYKMDQALGINVIFKPICNCFFLFYLQSVVNIEIPKTPGPLLIYQL